MASLAIAVAILCADEGFAVPFLWARCSFSWSKKTGTRRVKRTTNIIGPVEPIFDLEIAF